ncbi:hypothetical protein AAG570_003163 [Ranatra chinensis]|uniref:Maturase n=1 Tax=Ranatra chinensis TaxID=642074 RepID=A0ABD0Y6F7_9HEMI
MFYQNKKRETAEIENRGHDFPEDPAVAVILQLLKSSASHSIRDVSPLSQTMSLPAIFRMYKDLNSMLREATHRWYSLMGHCSTRRLRGRRFLSRRDGFKGWVEGDREGSFKFGVKGFEFFADFSDCGDIEVHALIGQLYTVTEMAKSESLILAESILPCPKTFLRTALSTPGKSCRDLSRVLSARIIGVPVTRLSSVRFGVRSNEFVSHVAPPLRRLLNLGILAGSGLPSLSMAAVSPQEGRRHSWEWAVNLDDTGFLEPDLSRVESHSRCSLLVELGHSVFLLVALKGVLHPWRFLLRPMIEIRGLIYRGGPVFSVCDCRAEGPGFDSLRGQSRLKARLASRPLGVQYAAYVTRGGDPRRLGESETPPLRRSLWIPPKTLSAIRGNPSMSQPPRGRGTSLGPKVLPRPPSLPLSLLSLPFLSLPYLSLFLSPPPLARQLSAEPRGRVALSRARGYPPGVQSWDGRRFLHPVLRTNSLSKHAQSFPPSRKGEDLSGIGSKVARTTPYVGHGRIRPCRNLTS